MGNPLNVLRNSWHLWNIFWHNSWTRNARNLDKGSKNACFSLESQNTTSHNIGAWDQMMTSS